MDRWCAITVGRKVILLETVLMVLFSLFLLIHREE